MSYLKCPAAACGSENLEATYRCDPCNKPSATGRTDWIVHPVPQDPNTAIPARQKCPGCGVERGAIWVTCYDCGHSWAPAVNPVATALGDGKR